MKKLFTLSIIATLSLYAQTFNVSTVSQFRQALQKAATDGENDTIVLAPGVYKTDGDGGGTFKYYSEQDNNLTIIGSDDNKTILSGDNKDQILNYQITKPSTTLILKNLVFMDGNNTDSDGGAVYSNSNIIVKDCSFINNTSDEGGGGFYSNENATVINSTFNNNKSYGYYNYKGGGGFYSNENATVINSTFNNNSANSEDGGGFYSDENATVINSTFINNNAYDGGGLESKISIIIDSIFKNNSNVFGGACESGGSIIINSLFISNNIAIYLRWNELYVNPPKLIAYIYNSIFINNNSDIDSINNNNVVDLYNNYIDLVQLSKSNVNVIAKSNIFKNVNLGFKDPKNGNYELTASSDLIDKGTTQGIENLIPKTDLAGNPRIVGKAIDIGPYEYQGNNTNQNTETNITNIANETNTTENNSTNETDIKVGAGWNMINIPTDISNVSNIDAVSIWKWNSDWKSWQAYAKDPNLENKLSLNYNIIDTLKAGNGVWVDEDKAKILTFENPAMVKVDWDNLTKGWNLKGTGEDINLTTIPSKVKMVWYWDNPNKKWMVYSNDANISKLLKPYYSKGTFEKINKLEANKAYWFFVE